MVVQQNSVDTTGNVTAGTVGGWNRVANTALTVTAAVPTTLAAQSACTGVATYTPAQLTSYVRFIDTAGHTLVDNDGSLFALTNFSFDTQQTLNISSQSSGSGAGLVFETSGAATLSIEYGALQQQITTSAACFATGTRIATPSGMVMVDALHPGASVSLAAGGAAVIRAIGRRDVDCTNHPMPHDVLPVRIRAGSFGAGLPVRDLMLSPDHALYLDGVLIPVRHLEDGDQIARQPARSVRYFHILLDHHAVILAEGLPVESYLDQGDTTPFDHIIGPLEPDRAMRPCAPAITQGPILEALRRRLASLVPA